VAKLNQTSHNSVLKKCESSWYFGSVRETSKEVTEWLNDASGGNDIEAGSIDISPEVIDHSADFFTGGTASFLLIPLKLEAV
jgi:hypothetical protein